MSKKTRGVVVGGLGLMLTSTLVSGAVSSRRASAALPAVVAGAAPWAPHLVAVDAALRAGDVTTALSEWHEAYGAALGSRRWDGFADAGDAYLKIGRASGAPARGVPRARDLYLSALFRARDARSVDGVLRVAAAFEALGDHEVTAHALRMAERLAGPAATLELRQRLSALETSAAVTPGF